MHRLQAHSVAPQVVSLLSENGEEGVVLGSLRPRVGSEEQVHVSNTGGWGWVEAASS